LNHYYPIENISPFEETPSFDDPPTTSPDFDPDVLEREVDNPTFANDSIPHIAEVKTSLNFIRKLQNARLDSNIEPLDSDLLKCIRNPPAGSVDFTPDEHFSIEIFLSINNSSEETYNDVRQTIMRRFLGTEILSFYRVKTLLNKSTGVTPIVHEMCINSCIAYTGTLKSIHCDMYTNPCWLYRRICGCSVLSSLWSGPIRWT
jgi:hypothetical protein